MDRLQQLWILNLQVLPVNPHRLILVRASIGGSLGERHDKRLQLPRPLLQELAARRDITAGRIDPIVVKISEHGQFRSAGAELKEIVLGGQGCVDLTLQHHHESAIRFADARGNQLHIFTWDQTQFRQKPFERVIGAGADTT